MKTKIIEIAVIDCQECEGTGSVLVGPICFKPASECCGGCFEELSCNICDGYGTVDTIELNEDLHKAAKIYNALIETDTHPVWKLKIENGIYEYIEQYKLSLL